MEIKQTRPGTMKSMVGLGGADKQIDFLSQKILPSVPHLFSVPTKTPYQPTFIHENQNTPFDQREVMSLQYMTLISNGDRGVGHTAGNWQDEMNDSPPLSAGAQSGTGTPNSQKDPKKPSVKMSIADYKNRKTTGFKPLPGPSAPTTEAQRGSDGNGSRSGHARNTSSASIGTPMARVPSVGDDNSQNEGGATVKTGQKVLVQEESLPLSRRPHPERAEESRTSVNGHSNRDSQARETGNNTSSSRPNTQQSTAPLKHPLPPRPQSPRQNPEPKQQKRSRDSGDASHPEKRVKGERGEVRTPSNPQYSIPRNSEAHSQSRPSPSHKSIAPHSQVLTPPKKAAHVSTKQVESKMGASKPPEKPLKLPKILSPLPDDLIIPPQSNPTSLKMSDLDKATPPETTSKGLSPDTIVVKTSRPRDSASSSSRPASSKTSDGLPPFVLPRLLSPDLPDIVEAELLRLKEKGSTILNTVESRHGKVRQPGALGVAQRTQRPKIGHPPKKSHTESTKKIEAIKEEQVNSLVVKIRYKKRLAKDIQRVLALPSKSIKKREADLLRERSTSAAPPTKDTSDSEDDTPIAASRSNKAPAGTTGQKRPSGSSDRKEPGLKPSKHSEVVDFAKPSTPVTPAFKSPGPSASKDKGPLAATPMKGDTMKSAAMRKIDSSEGRAHTPQSGNTSTPASAEKSRINGLAPQVVTQELARASQENEKYFPLGTTLKRKMDAILKNPDATEDDRKSGFMHGIEGLLCYMLAFHARDKTSTFRNHAPRQENWAEFFALWTHIEKKTPQYPELHALMGQLGAVSREQWNKANIEQPKERRDWEMTVSNLKERDRLWAQCKRDEHLILNLGVTTTLGPWSTVGEAVGFGVATLTFYAKNQGGLDWKKDANFSASYAKAFMGEEAGRPRP